MIKIFGLKIARKYFNLFSYYVLRNIKIRHFEPSIIYSKEDLGTNSNLIELASNSAIVASKNILKCGNVDLEESKLFNVFPGEHYRFLNAFVKVTNRNSFLKQ